MTATGASDRDLSSPTIFKLFRHHRCICELLDVGLYKYHKHIRSRPGIFLSLVFSAPEICNAEVRDTCSIRVQRKWGRSR